MTRIAPVRTPRTVFWWSVGVCSRGRSPVMPSRNQHDDAEQDPDHGQDRVELAKRLMGVVRSFTSPVRGHLGPLRRRENLANLVGRLLSLREPQLRLFQLVRRIAASRLAIPDQGHLRPVW